MTKRTLSVGKQAYSSFSAASTGDENTRLLWSVPRNTTFTAQILCDNDHLISGTLCHYYGAKDGELVWEHTGDDDPATDLEVHPRFSFVIPMMVKTPEGDKVQKNVRFPKSIARKVEDIVVRQGSIENMVVTVSRDDTGDWAAYDIVPTGQVVSGDLSGFNQDDWVNCFLEIVFAGTAEETADWLDSKGVKTSAASTATASTITTEEF